MKLVTKKQKGDADTLSMKKLEKKCGRINAGPRQITNPANYKKDGDTREAEAISLKISSEETSTTKKIGGVTEKPTPAADINVRAFFVASQPMENHPLGRYLSRNVAIETKGRTASNPPTYASSGMKYEYQKYGTSFYDDQETKAPDFHSQDINKEKSSADYSLMPPNLTNS